MAVVAFAQEQLKAGSLWTLAHEHRLIVAVSLRMNTVFFELVLANVRIIVTICRGLTTDSRSVFTS